LTFDNCAAVYVLCSVIKGHGAVSASRINFYKSLVGGLFDYVAGVEFSGLVFQYIAQAMRYFGHYFAFLFRKRAAECPA
jgi:hypothetical protein